MLNKSGQGRISALTAAICLVVGVYLLVFAGIKRPSDPWDRVLNSDGKGYYAYLPAIFIYNDLSFSFLDEYEKIYYPPNGELYKDFRVKVHGGTVNKYFPGLSVLWLPFFLLADVSAYLFSFPADGYSPPYQWAIALSAFCYLALALLMLGKILNRFTANRLLAAFIVALTGLATNLVYYTVVEGSMVHVYNFFLINLFILSVLKSTENALSRYFLATALAFGLIIITRPQNGLILLSLPFLTGSSQKFRQYLLSFFKSRSLIPALLLFLLILAYPVCIWFYQSGNLLVYTYGNEHFDFTNPHLFKFLLSFEKGWLIYTPVFVVSLAGFYSLFRRSRWMAISLLLFLGITVSILSSWWAWNYTSQFGQRVMIDYYTFFAIMLVVLISDIPVRIARRVLILFLLLFIPLNLLQFYQQVKWVYPRGPIGYREYFANFLRLKPGTTYLIPKAKVLNYQEFNSGFESHDALFDDTGVIATLDARSGEKVKSIDGKSGSLLFVRPCGILKKSEGKQVLVVGMHILPKFPDSSMVIRVNFGNQRNIYSQNSYETSLYLQPGIWTYIEYALQLPNIRSVHDSIFIRLENNGNSQVLMDDARVVFYSLKNDESYDWIPNAQDDISKALFFSTDLEKPVGVPWKSGGNLTTGRSFSGSKSDLLDKQHPYSFLFERNTEEFRGATGHIRAQARIFAEQKPELYLVFDFYRNGTSASYSAIPIGRNIIPAKWNLMETLFELPYSEEGFDSVRIYYFLPKPVSELWLDDPEIEFAVYKPKKYQTVNFTKTVESAEKIRICEDFENTSSRLGLLRVKSLGQNTVCVSDSSGRFSYALKIPLIEVVSKNLKYLRFSARILSDRYRTGAVLVADFRNGGKSLFYLPYYQSNINIKGHWTKTGYEMPLPARITAQDTLVTYFYIPASGETLLIDDMCAEFLPLPLP